MSAPSVRLSPMGSGACLLDAAGPVYSPAVQERVWTAAAAARAIPGALEAVPGMNNLLLTFDPLAVDPAALRRAFLDVWADVIPRSVAGRSVTVPVVYGGAHGEDLDEFARRAGVPVEEAVRRHAGVTYTVAAVGAMPGFPYLGGLDPALAWPRRPSPRLVVREGSVIVGGAQAAVMPCTAPSGWHIIGRTGTRLFDPAAAEPALLRPGDTVRFTVQDIVA